jgi:uncharacterized protein YjbI with pentapeptide repeats
VVENPLEPSVDSAATRGNSAFYDTFTALRRAHVELKQSLSGTKQPVDTIRSFIKRAKATGAILENEKERKAAQGIIDYWSIEFVSSPGATSNDLMPPVLDPFDLQFAANAGEQPPQADTKHRGRSPEVIRFAAAARLWRDSGKKHGYLLFGEAVDRAAQFEKLDSDIADLVRASKRARNEFRKGVILLIGTAVTVLLTAIAVFALFRYHYFPLWKEQDIAQIKDPNYREKQVSNFYQLAFLQRWLPPGVFDLSAVRLKDLGLPKLSLFAPSFVLAEIDNVDFQGAELSGVSFSDSLGIKNTHFDLAKLDFADFRNATIVSTSFKKADLRRAVFDGARLCGGLDFAEAELYKASFVNVTFGDDFVGYFAKTAWWRGVGWNAAQLRALSQVDRPDLSKTEAFVREMDLIKKKLGISRVGSYDRAEGLNSFAWALATYGISLTSAKNAPSAPQEACTKAEDLPENARDAAAQAVCIVKSLNSVESERGVYALAQATFEDTLAYVLIQTDDLDGAAMYLKDAEKLLDNSGLFRYSIVEYAEGEKDNKVDIKAKAILDMKRSMENNEFFPSHELNRLKKYITGELKVALDEQIDLRLGPGRKLPSCPASTP